MSVVVINSHRQFDVSGKLKFYVTAMRDVVIHSLPRTRDPLLISVSCEPWQHEDGCTHIGKPDWLPVCLCVCGTSTRF